MKKGDARSCRNVGAFALCSCTGIIANSVVLVLRVIRPDPEDRKTCKQDGGCDETCK